MSTCCKTNKNICSNEFLRSIIVDSFVLKNRFGGKGGYFKFGFIFNK